MNRFFNIDNPVWKFIGNLADFFLLSILTVALCIPIVTVGAALTSLSYVTLKMASNQEGKLFQQYFNSFKRNFRQITPVWLIILAIGVVLCIDVYYGIHAGTLLASSMLVTAVICIVLYLCVRSMIFVLFARVENTSSAIVKMAVAMVTRNFLPVLSTVIVTVAFIAVGVYVFWPMLLITPGLPAYINAFVYNRIITKYGLNLKDEDPFGET